MKNVLCSAEKSSVIWAEPHSRSLAEQFGRTERSVDHYLSVRITQLTHEASNTKMPTTAGTRKVNTPVRSYSMAKATPMAPT